MQNKQTDEMKRTTVSFDDEQYAILEEWAEKEVRTVPNLIAAIVVSALRGEALTPPSKKDSKDS